jgi:triacylglycerol lipase
MKIKVLIKKIKTIGAISGSPKVNLLGHSQGGIDIRYVAGVALEYTAAENCRYEFRDQ